MMIGIIKLYILVSAGWPSPSFTVTIVWEIKNFGVHFLRNFVVDLDKLQYDATTCWFVEAHARFVSYK